MPKIQAVTVTSDLEHPGLARLAQSAKFWGWDLQVWHQTSGWERETYRAEQEGLYQAIQQDLPTWVLYLDAWDTMFVGPPQELPLREHQVTFCGDEHCFPTETWRNTFPPVGHGEFPYLNAGVFWGWGPTIRELCTEYLDLNNRLCNQDFFSLRYLYEQGTGRGRLAIDHPAQVALNLWGMHPRYSQLTRKFRRLAYKPTDTRPLVLHAAGTNTFHDLAPMPQVGLNG